MPTADNVDPTLVVKDNKVSGACSCTGVRQIREMAEASQKTGSTSSGTLIVAAG